MHSNQTQYTYQLDTDTVQDLIEKAEHIDNNKELLSAFLILPIEKLIANDLLIRLFKNASHDDLKNIIKSVVLNNHEQIKKCQSMALVALLMSIGNEYIEPDDFDYITLHLLAWHYSDNDEKNDKIFRNLDTKQYHVNEIHLLLAAKIDTGLYNLLAEKFYTDLKSEPENIKKISLLQNTVYIKNRAEKLYPSMFGLPENSTNNSWLFWQGKHREKTFSLEKPLYRYALNYMHEREITLINGQKISAPFNKTVQYINSPAALKNITENSWLLSQQARESADMFFASCNTVDDILKGDSNLVCTAPLSVNPTIYNFSMAKIIFDLARLPVSKLQNCIIKMCDYVGRLGNLPPISITPTMQMHILPFESDCNLITMSIDPLAVAFENLPLEPGFNACILFNDKLFYAEKTNRKVIEITPNPGRQQELALLKSKFQNTPTRLQPEDMPLFYHVTNYAPQNLKTSRYLFFSQSSSYMLSIPGIHEIFHGINGFKEALTHFLFIINALPNDGEGKLFKNEILAYMDDLEKTGNLHDYLDWVFKQLFNYMEIDFPYGLPLSLDYTSSIEFLNFNLPKMDFDEISRLSRTGTLGHYEPELISIPAILQQVLKAVSPEYLPSMVTFLEETYPESFILALHRWSDLLNKNMQELKIYISQMPHINSPYDLTSMIAVYKEILSGNPQLCQDIVTRNATNLHDLINRLRNLYQHFTFAGGESKLREIFLDAGIMMLLTRKNGEIIASIVALDIQNEQNLHPVIDTTIQTVISQRTQKEIRITLESILNHILLQPTLFLESYPVNSPLPDIVNMRVHNKNILLAHIRQRILCKYLYTKLEQSIIKLCEQIPTDSSQKKEHPSYDLDQWHLYASQIRDISWIDAGFCKNPEIISEVNTALTMLIPFIFGNVIKPSMETLVINLLESTVLLDPQIGHILFDSTHFPTALRGEGINRIPLADKIFKYILVVENKSDIKNMDEDGLTVVYEHGELTIFWLDKSVIKSESLVTEELQDFIHLLPDFGKTEEPVLIQQIINNCTCARQDTTFHDLMITCAGYLADKGVNLSNALMAEQLALRIKKTLFDFNLSDNFSQDPDYTSRKLFS